MPKTYHIGTQVFDPPSLPAALYLVPTPIGNLSDITIRALQVLAAVDVIACEDTRVTVKLLERYGIRNPLRPYHDHNAEGQGARLLDEIASGKSVAIATDAGTPLVSDPGFPLVRDAIARGLKVEALPGASALLPALQLSAMPTDRFSFMGFLPQKQGQRLKVLTDVQAREETMVFYESPHRILETVADMMQIMGNRPLSISREISKLHEETLRGTAAEIYAALEAKPVIKGEFVIVIGAQDRQAREHTEEEIDAAIKSVLASHPASKAAAMVSKSLGLSRDVVYARILALKEKA